MSNDLIDAAAMIVEMAQSMGASEVTAFTSHGTYTDVKQRDGSIEKWQDSQSRSASAALFVDERFSVHSTNDLRPQALKAFIHRAIEATRHLEPDPNRRLPDASIMGEAKTSGLELVDPSEPKIDHRTWVDEMQQATTAAIPKNLRSVEGFVWSGSSASAMVTSNGFASTTATTEYGQGAEVSMEDIGGKLPEAYDYALARHHNDLPSIASIAESVAQRGAGQLGSGPVTSRRGAMLVENRVASRIIGTLVGPMSGASIFEQRSCMADKLGTQIAASGFNLIDMPHMVRGLGSATHDGDGIPTTQRHLVENGVLNQWLINIYYGRKLERPPTSGGTSNLVVPPGKRSTDEILADHDWTIKVDGFLGGNSNAATGKYSFGIRGTLYEKGVAISAVSEMNITGSIFDLMGGFIEAANDPWMYGATQSPSLLFDAVQFSGQ